MSGWKAGDVVTGPYLVARNNATTGIHTDEFAQRQGFARAVVAGPNHLTFVSTLIEVELGAAWLERGRLGVRFSAPVYDGDQVRVLLKINGVGEAFAAEYQSENAAAGVVATGTAGWVPANAEDSLPPPAPSSPEEQLLDLKAIQDGERIPAETVIAATDQVAAFCDLHHDHLARPERVPASYLSPMLFAPARRFLTERGVGPGMWGQLDIRQHRPLRPDTPYRYEGTVLSRRRRGNLEIVDFAFAAREADGTLACAISHSHLIPHRDRPA